MVNVQVKVREYIFWFFDWISGNRVKEAYEGIKKYDLMDSSSDELIKYQQTALQKLLKHAVQTTDYYKELNPAQKELKDFPVVDKTFISDNQESFLSKTYKINQLTAMATSGSTGTPFTCYQNKDKKKRVNTEIIYYSGKAGYSIGKNLINLRAMAEGSSKAKLRQWLQNTTVIDMGLISDQRIEELLTQLEKASKNGSLLLAYASTYDILSDYFKRNRTKNSCNIFGMISISEVLFDDTRAKMEEVFRCRCFSRYSNQENGVIGQDGMESNVFIINDAHYLIEVLKVNEDIEVEEGEIGRIVVTDLYNYAMPMIRYDTGDIGSITYIKRNGISKKAINNFSGRKIDLVYNSNGACLSPHKISVVFRNFKEVKQFQFVQEDQADYLVRLIANTPFRGESELKGELSRLLGEKAVIKFEFVDYIPDLGSGKRNYIINKMYGDKI